MQKYFVNKIINNSISFQKSDEHHILKVMRMKIGDQVIAIDNNKKYLAKIINLEPLRAQLINEIISDTKNNFELNVFQANIKPKYLEIAIQKATELNVDNFYICNYNLSQNNIIHNLERYKKIIKEASEQSNRNNLMKIELLETSEQIFKKMKESEIVLVADIDKNKNKTKIKEVLNTKNKLAIAIGPEGGFNDYDYENIFNKLNSLLIINLTKTILRSETAMMYLVSVVSYIMLEYYNEK